LHLFWDLFGMTAGQDVAIYVDSGAYPIARWGVERAAARGVPARLFAHHDAKSLRQKLKAHERNRARPLIVTDGLCPGCGQAAPLAAYLDCAQAFGGCLILDDTQALGVFGCSPGPGAPYGQGGGGMLRWSRIGGPDVLVVSSLAKAFGVPVAVLSGSRTAIKDFESRSETRMHCSPPSMAVVHAAEHALDVNRKSGDAFRQRLAQLVARFRRGMAAIGLWFHGALFPVQTLASTSGPEVIGLHERLLRAGIRAVLHGARSGHGARLSFLITARHLPQEIDFVVDRLAHALPQGKLRTAVGGEHL
jgi:8-amino-7-oxononanoate synthase